MFFFTDSPPPPSLSRPGKRRQVPAGHGLTLCTVTPSVPRESLTRALHESVTPQSGSVPARHPAQRPEPEGRVAMAPCTHPPSADTLASTVLHGAWPHTGPVSCGHALRGPLQGTPRLQAWPEEKRGAGPGSAPSEWSSLPGRVPSRALQPRPNACSQLSPWLSEAIEGLGSRKACLPGRRHRPSKATLSDGPGDGRPVRREFKCRPLRRALRSQRAVHTHSLGTCCLSETIPWS